MREIRIAVNLNESTETENVYNAGLMFEHNTTNLVFELEEALINTDYKYYLDFATPSGIVRTDYLVPDTTGALPFLLPAAVTSQMSVICCLNIIRVNETTYETEEVIKPKLIRLSFSTVEGDSKELAESYDFSINAMLEAIKNGDFKGEKGDKGDTGAKGEKGDKGDTGTVVADSQLNAESSNPVENKVVTAALEKKVDKVNGMGLSSNDFTDEYKLKIDSAEKTANKITEFTGAQTDEQYPSAKLVHDNFVLSQIYTDNGLAQKVDKVSGKMLSTNDFTNSLKQKLNGIESGANKTVTDSSLSGTSANPVENKIIKAELDKKVDKVNGKELSSNDFTDDYKLKVDGIESGANKTITDSVLSTTSANPVENKVVTTMLNKKLNLSGGTMSGNLTMGGKDILSVKKIVFLSENGEWLNMSNHSITNLATPTADNHAANKAYVDNSTKDIPKLSNNVNEIKSIVTGEMPFGIIKDSYINKDGVITPYQGWNRTEPVNCEGLTKFSIDIGDYAGNEYNAFYDADNQFIKYFASYLNPVNVPQNAATFIMSAPASALAKYKITRESIDKRINDLRKYVDNALVNIPKITVDTELSNTSENPVQNKVLFAAIKDSMPTLVTFNNADFTTESKTKIYLSVSDAYLHLTASFDVSRLNFVIPENADIAIKNVIIDSEAIDLSLLDEAIKSTENFTEDYGESWNIRDNVYQNTHKYKFSSSTTAKTALDELQSNINLTGFQLLIKNYNQITAAEVGV